MEYIILKNSDLKVSRLCMGGCPMGGYGWGKTSEQDFIDAIHTGLDHGLNFFDTSDTYGLGHSEKVLAKGLGSRRHEAVIQSKFGVRVMQDMIGRKTIYDNSPDYIRKALDGTLQRLGTDYVDIYTIHYRDKETPIEAVVDALRTLKKEGKIRYFGLSNIHEEGMAEIEAYKSEFVCCQDEFSLACRKNEAELRKIDRELSITPLTWGSLGQGILTGKYDKSTIFASNDRRSGEIYVNFHGEKLLRNLDIVEAMKPIAEAHHKPVSAVAIRFIFDWLEDSVALVGAKRPSQMLGNLEAMDWKLTEEELDMLDKVSQNDLNNAIPGIVGGMA